MKQEREEKKRKKRAGEPQRQGDASSGAQKTNPSTGQPLPKNPPPKPGDIDDDEEEEAEERRSA